MKHILTKTITLAALCGILAGLASGCAWSIGEGKDRHVTNPPTKGQELVDLKKARDQGAITEEEYNNQRTQILNR